MWLERADGELPTQEEESIRGAREDDPACIYHTRPLGRDLGFATNALLRMTMAYFLLEVLRHPHDSRFEGKALPARNLVIVSALTLLVPFLHMLRQRPKSYPIWHDNLYLSMFWLDMAGNCLDLYDRYLHFDLIPHCHGAGAVVLREALDLSPLSAMGVASRLHILLEAQEYYTDVLFGTHNVRGERDTIGDLLAGIVGTTACVTAATGLRNQRVSLSPVRSVAARALQALERLAEKAVDIKKPGE